MLTGGAGVEPLPECYNTVTRNDIIDKLLFVVRILKERDDTYVEKLEEKGYKKKCAVGLLLQKTLERTKTC